jgi:phage gpG-like protein
MAGAQVSASIDSAKARRAIAAMVNVSANLQPALEEIGASLLTSTQERFESAESPDGVHWAPWSPAYALRRNPARFAKTVGEARRQNRKAAAARTRGENQILVKSNLLLQSVTYLAGDGEVDVGTNKIYGAIHQFGGRGIPARPYLGLSPDDSSEIGEILVERMLEAVP